MLTDTASISKFLQERLENTGIPSFENICCHLVDDDEDTLDGEYAEFARLMGASDWDNGATKLVLWFDEIPDYVVKIPFYGRIHHEMDDNGCWEEIESYSYHGADMATIFRDVPCDDYCAVESRVYEEAFNMDMAQFFAQTFFLMEKFGVAFYLSRKIDNTLWSSHFNVSDGSLVRASRMSYTGFSESHIVACFIECYGEKDTQTLVEFVEAVNITDLHDDNVGITADGKVVIIDYSGYNE